MKKWGGWSMAATDASLARFHGFNDPYYDPGLDMPSYNKKKNWRRDDTYDEEIEDFDDRRWQKA